VRAVDSPAAATIGAMNQMHCSACGAAAKATCKCGVAYIPAGEFAARAVAAHPEKSDRAIAQAIGVGHQTVARARKAGGPNGPPERIGRDGKRQTATKAPSTALQIARFEAQRARAEAAIKLFLPDNRRIPKVPRDLLIAALATLNADHPAEQARTLLGLTWNELIVPHEDESKMAITAPQRPIGVAPSVGSRGSHGRPHDLSINGSAG
jgi:hypothetical protein